MHLGLTEYDATEITTQFVKMMTNFLQCIFLSMQYVHVSTYNNIHVVQNKATDS